MTAANSGAIKRDYSFTVRLSPEEKTALETLAERFDLDKSATVRRALHLALNSGKVKLPESGQFVPLHSEVAAFPVRLSGKGSHDG
jgi:hypothetical protein